MKENGGHAAPLPICPARSAGGRVGIHTRLAAQTRYAGYVGDLPIPRFAALAIGLTPIGLIVYAMVFGYR